MTTRLLQTRPLLLCPSRRLSAAGPAGAGAAAAAAAVPEGEGREAGGAGEKRVLPLLQCP